MLTLTLLEICLIYCPIKVISKNRASARVQISSRRKRKIHTQLEEATNLSHCPQFRIDSLKCKLALAHIDIRDAINNDLLLREHQAVEKVMSNPKYFYSYAKKFSKKKSSIYMLFYKDGSIKSNPKEIANFFQNQFSSMFSDPSKTNIESASATFASPSIAHPFTNDMLKFFKDDIIKAIEEIMPNAASGPDEVPVLLLKSCKVALARPIHIL